MRLKRFFPSNSCQDCCFKRQLLDYSSAFITYAGHISKMIYEKSSKLIYFTYSRWSFSFFFLLHVSRFCSVLFFHFLCYEIFIANEGLARTYFQNKIQSTQKNSTNRLLYTVGISVGLYVSLHEIFCFLGNITCCPQKVRLKNILLL